MTQQKPKNSHVLDKIKSVTLGEIIDIFSGTSSEKSSKKSAQKSDSKSSPKNPSPQRPKKNTKRSSHKKRPGTKTSKKSPTTSARRARSSNVIALPQRTSQRSKKSSSLKRKQLSLSDQKKDPKQRANKSAKSMLITSHPAKVPHYLKNPITGAIYGALAQDHHEPLETVDFSNPHRDLTCLEVDFPIHFFNPVTRSETHSPKPIYNLTRWCSRSRSSLSRAMLLAATTRAPREDVSAGHNIWRSHYQNHQNNPALRELIVADPFMGSGTTVIEATRIGVQVHGSDLNPVAWFLAKASLNEVPPGALPSLLGNIERAVRHQIMPYYTAPMGSSGIPTGRWYRGNKKLPGNYHPAELPYQQRDPQDRYQGPEIIHYYWAHYGECRVTGCGHRTPLLSLPIVFTTSVSVRYQEVTCPKCHHSFDLEDRTARLAPGMPIVDIDERPHAQNTAPNTPVSSPTTTITCPHCLSSLNNSQLTGPHSLPKHDESSNKRRSKKIKKKKVTLSVLLSYEWLSGQDSTIGQGAKSESLGGRYGDDLASTQRWYEQTNAKNNIFEVRGDLPEVITCPYTKKEMRTNHEGTPLTGNSRFACGHCGTVQTINDDSAKRSSRTSPSHSSPMDPEPRGLPMSVFAVLCYDPQLDGSEGDIYNGRYFSSLTDTSVLIAAEREWLERKDKDLKDFWPRTSIPRGGIETNFHDRGYEQWVQFFSPMQRLALSQLLRAIMAVDVDISSAPDQSDHDDKKEDQKNLHHKNSSHTAQQNTRELALLAYQAFLRYHNIFFERDHRGHTQALGQQLRMMLTKSFVDSYPFSRFHCQSWLGTINDLYRMDAWKKAPWEIIPTEELKKPFFADYINPGLLASVTSQGVRVPCTDSLSGPLSALSQSNQTKDLSTRSEKTQLHCTSSTDLHHLDVGSVDIMITDPPVCGMQYGEVFDFFYAWLRLSLKDLYPQHFSAHDTPKCQEVICHELRHGSNCSNHFRNLLRLSWHEAYRVLKDGGILSFAFHHSKDEIWEWTLESLFEAGFYLESTYPIGSKQVHVIGHYGSKKLSYDLIHVCRKRLSPPSPISWPKLRSQILADLCELQPLIEHAERQGLSEGDQQLIRYCKGLKRYSLHYGQVFKDRHDSTDQPLGVKEALWDIKQLVNEEYSPGAHRLPHHIDGTTRQFLSIFAQKDSVPKDQVTKLLRGTGINADIFKKYRWCSSKGRAYQFADPVLYAQSWAHKKRSSMVRDFDQAWFLVGACMEGSQINVTATLKHHAFMAHRSLGDLLEWLSNDRPSKAHREAARKAAQLYRDWAKKNPTKAKGDFPVLDLKADDDDDDDETENT